LKAQGYTVKFDESFTNKSSKIRGYCSYQAWLTKIGFVSIIYTW
jgi:hypothetical protein